MKKITTILLCLSFSINFAQDLNEKIVSSEISEVIVFIKGAQITRQKTVELKKGDNILKFTKLSPFINATSVQVKLNGNATVLSVNHQLNFIEKLEKNKELATLEVKLQQLRDLIQLENTYLDIVKEELGFLNENRNIGGKNEELSVTNLKEASSFYGTKLTSLKLKEIDRNKKLHQLKLEEFDIDKQIKTMTSEKNFANGEILVKVESKDNSESTFEISYVVGNAGWLPTYDIRAKNVNEPVALVYKAKVQQDTKIDWKNVKLSLSSADPNISGVAPELKTYYLNYNTAPPRYNRAISQVTGKVQDNNSEPLPGVTVMVKGTTIGTATDFDGRYNITLPETSSQLVFSYIGFETQTLTVGNPVHNIRLIENNASLDEVVVVGFGNQKKREKVGGLQIQAAASTSIPLVQVENQTTINFEINMPYSIPSDNKNYSVDMANYNLPADYQYYSVPKIENEAFLIASIKDWEQYNLLEGEANIFFEDTYVGKTILDVRFASDSLQISLGRDKNVVVDRRKVSEYASKKFIGSKKEESRDWLITVKNNKSERINMLIMDQVPVSTHEDIKIEILDLSQGKQDANTGEVRWEFDLEPNKNKDINLKYIVKYPKNRNLIIE